MKKNYILFLVLLLYNFYNVPIKAMNDFEHEIVLLQPQSLQETCARKICESLSDIQSYDIDAEEKKLKETLEKVPENWQQKIIEAIHMRTGPEWSRKTNVYINGVHSFFSMVKDLVFYKADNEVHIRDIESDPQMHYSFPHPDIQGICKAPNAPLLAIRSSSSLDIFSCNMPIKHITKIPIECSKMVFSYDEQPKLFAINTQNQLTVFSNLESQEYIFDHYNFPETTEIKYLKLSPDNSFLVATSRFASQPSYIITFEYGAFTFKPLYDPIYNPCIASDGSFFVAHLPEVENESHKSTFFYKKSGQTLTLDGELITVKNDYIFTRIHPKGCTQFSYKIFNYDGILQYCSSKSPIDYANGYLDLYALKNTTMQDTKNIIYKIACRKAIDQKNINVLKKLLLTDNPYIGKIEQTIADMEKQKESEKEYSRKVLKSIKRINETNKNKKNPFLRAIQQTKRNNLKTCSFYSTHY